jgi:phosphoesterase RecJ-like protein
MIFREHTQLIRDIARLTINAKTVWNLPHENPDGDTIGCALAIHHALKSLRRRVRTFFSEPVPKIYTFLPGAGEIEETLKLPDELPDLIFVSDNATFERLGAPYRSELARLGVYSMKDARHQHSRTKLINIDHHPSNELYGDINLVIPEAAATGEIVYAIFRQLKLPLPLDAAKCLYAAILTDTGKFSYSNTTLNTMEVATELVRAGVVPNDVVEAIYYTQSIGQLRMLGQVLQSLKVNEELVYCYSFVTQDMLAHFNGDISETEFIVDTLKTLDQPLLCFFFKVVDEGLVKASVRSRGDFDSAAVAARFGGGGHFAAAGFRFKGTLDEAIAALENVMRDVRAEQRSKACR